MIKNSILIFSLFFMHLSVAAENDYITLMQNYSQLRTQFNADRGKTRLLFIVGPSCGVCLRGMADLNQAFIAEKQDTQDLQTYVVHVPALGAEAHHVGPAKALLDGPQIRHYWQPEGNIGVDFMTTLQINQYAWDVWMIYGPDAVWQDDAPPVPDFWQHQLSRLRGSHDNYLDAAVFRRETLKYLEPISE